jgi:acetolactate decarboxylase
MPLSGLSKASLRRSAQVAALFASTALLLVACSSNTANPPASAKQNDQTLTQISTYPALQAGGFDGDTNYADLAQYGDFGLGTFDALHGEMIALDGVFYQGFADGSVKKVDPKAETPFADVHFFESNQQIKLQQPLQSVKELTAYLDTQLPSRNRPYAFRIHATFPTISIRSVPEQPQPFPNLQEAVSSQVVFDKENLAGTLVGYWVPDYLAGIALPGYHFHFISDDRQQGGHMLKLSINEATIDIDHLESVKLVIPQNPSFQESDFSQK